MKTHIELPLAETPYTTLHNHGALAGVFHQNPSLRNFHLSRSVRLCCTRQFLEGYTSPKVNVLYGDFTCNPHIERMRHDMRFLGTNVHLLIRRLLSSGYYVVYTDIDDFYVPGKTFYHERHFPHDGMIYGYDMNRKTYLVYAYDKDWRYSCFETTQSGFERGRRAAMRDGKFGIIWGLKARDTQIDFSLSEVKEHIRLNLESRLSDYPLDDPREVYGSATHDFIGMYLDKLYDGSIPYEYMDWRVFRMVWEHKKFMHERILRIEDTLSIPHTYSEDYLPLVESANKMRMLYAAHHRKRRDSLLPGIKNTLLSVKEDEERILSNLLEKMEVLS